MSVYRLAGAEIDDRITAGERVRSDGFFDDTTEGRSAGEEAWESVLSKCRQDASERKLPYMAHLLAGITFDTSVDQDTAHQVIAAAEQLTYRQLCLMRLAATKNAYPLRSDDYRGQTNHPRTHRLHSPPPGPLTTSTERLTAQDPTPLDPQLANPNLDLSKIS